MTVIEKPSATNIPFAQWRFVQLTAVMLVYLLIGPWLASLSLLKVIAQLVLCNTLFVTITATTGRKLDRRLKAAVWGIFVVSFAVALLEYAPVGDAGRQAAWYAELIVGTVLQASCATAILLHIARSGRVTIDNIFAAIVAYILIAVVFAMVYLLVWNVDPSAFNLPPDQMATTDDARITMIYFSFVTMATLGYGDILAIDPFARMVAIIEAMTGQFYVAILVGLLVGLYISHSTAVKSRQD